MSEVTDKCGGQTIDGVEFFHDGKQVQQALGRVLLRSITPVDDGHR